MKLSPIAIIVPVAAAVGFFAAQHWLKPAQAPATEASHVSTEPVLTLPEFSLQNRAGQMQSIKSWPGKTLLINFWATWCAPCRKEIPMLQTMQNKHAADGLQVVGVAVDFRDDVLKYAEAMKIGYPLLIGEQDGLAAVDAFGIQAVGFPYSVFVDARNHIVTTYIGELKAPQVEAALAIIERINRGDLPLGAGRTEVSATLAQLKSQVTQE
jgi:thiol-disulfide isomerase/thioredoxin